MSSSRRPAAKLLALALAALLCVSSTPLAFAEENAAATPEIPAGQTDQPAEVPEVGGDAIAPDGDAVDAGSEGEEVETEAGSAPDALEPEAPSEELLEAEEALKAQEEAASAVIPAGIYTLVNPAAGKVVDIAGASDADGAAAQLWERNGSLAQAFSVTRSSDGFYELRSVCSGKLLDADAGSAAPGSRVQQWGRESATNRQWTFQALPEGGYVLMCRATSLVLDVAGGATANGTALQTWTANSTPAQTFTLEPVTELLPEGFWTLRARTGSARAVEIAAGSPDQGGTAQIWSWNGTPAQRWRVASYGDGTVSLEALCSGMLLTQSGEQVVQAPAAAGAPSPTQRWRVEAAPFGGIALLNAESGQALDVSGAGDWDGCPLGAYTPNGTAAQAFAPSRVDQIAAEGCYEIICAADGRALDVTGGSRDNGANVQVWTPNGSGAQKWNVYGAGGGYYVIVNARSKKALDVRDFGITPGTNVQQWAKSNNNAQRWRIEYAGGGTYRLVSACGGLALDIEGAGGWDGANAQTWTPNNTPAQSFRMVPTTYVAPPEGAVKRADGSWDWYNANGDLDRAGAINKLMSTARSLLGVPYVWLGVYPQDGGMDCASFTWYVYRQLGIDIGFETYYQINDGYHVNSLAEAKPGDLILMYFGSWPNYNPLLPEHVVLYAGNGMIYEEPDFGGHCQYVPLSSKGAGRIEIRRIIHD
ncbi:MULTISPECIES: RICIN domain-containing protein [Gordonibacter]|uniref:RICIN domain-containing protein n=1 Tax=Gordonibacter faecis TaxID=3047475 RepID=A0ABT7DSJ4_9ACTN|nr:MULTISPECIES: RICIN domain-containing protein [unclassified Gordonibacter]MDJ1651140.1 RICIN domain-containing protein [Gordonibacter sp. KGMB12511]HIW76581.1 RICIN domain-containing protein [Candidatus Gordonibacter avicola]